MESKCFKCGSYNRRGGVCDVCGHSIWKKDEVDQKPEPKIEDLRKLALALMEKTEGMAQKTPGYGDAQREIASLWCEAFYELAEALGVE